MTRLIHGLISIEDLHEAEDLIHLEQKKIRDLAFKVIEGKLSNREIVDAVLDINPMAAVNHLLSCEVVEGAQK